MRPIAARISWQIPHLVCLGALPVILDLHCQAVFRVSLSLLHPQNFHQQSPADVFFPKFDLEEWKRTVFFNMFSNSINELRHTPATILFIVTAPGLLCIRRRSCSGPYQKAVSTREVKEGKTLSFQVFSMFFPFTLFHHKSPLTPRKKQTYPDRQRQVKSEDGLIHMMQEMH